STLGFKMADELLKSQRLRVNDKVFYQETVTNKMTRKVTSESASSYLVACFKETPKQLDEKLFLISGQQ
uniref:Uncharacterized protein n=1 Tax=Amphimedon queenslandica TaxID=400682 RepID=A0A1X7VIK7_AMPQE